MDELDSHTPDKYEYNYLDDEGLCLVDDSKSVQFWVKAAHDAHISLTNNKASDKTIEICLGGWGDTSSVIRSEHQQLIPIIKQGGGRLDANAYKPFWITWKDDIIVGEGTVIGQNQFMKAHIPQEIDFIGIATGWGATGDWAFGHGKESFVIYMFLN